jgi:EmrB/QacA subfamily drug resistance transporter
MAAPASLDRRRLYVVFSGLMLAMSLGALDQAIVATALPTIVSDLGGLEHLSWIITAYLLTATASTPLWGKLGDLYGRKHVFVATIAIFLAGSALCGLSRTMGQLIASRALQGIGGGGLIVTTQAAIGDIVSPRERGRYQGIFGGVFALMSVVGPLVGGFFVDYLSWHWVFFVNLPIGVAALAITAAAMPALQTRTKHAVDYAGAGLSAVATVCFVLPMTLGGVAFAWGSLQTGALLTAGAVLTWLFVRRERRAPEPLLPLGLFRNRVFRVSSALAFVAGGAMLGPITILPLFMQVADGVSPTDSGLRLLPLLLGVPAASITSGQVISRSGRYRLFPIAGTALMTVGLLLLSRLDAQTPTLVAAASMLVLGLGLGMAIQVLVLAVQNAVDFRDLGSATSGVTFFRAMGSVFGVALFGGIFASRLTTHAAGLLPANFNPALLDAQPAALAALPATMHTALVGAYSAALHPVFLAAAPFAALAFLLSWRLQEIPLRESVTATYPESAITPGLDYRSSAEIERILSELMTREGRRAIYERLAARAGVAVTPVESWLLFRLDEFKPRSVTELASSLSIDPTALRERLQGLAERGLIVLQAEDEPPRDLLIGVTSLGHETLDRLVQARREGLNRIVTSWVPERHAEVDELLRRLARVLVPDLRVEA